MSCIRLSEVRDFLEMMSESTDDRIPLIDDDDRPVTYEYCNRLRFAIARSI